MALGAGSFAAPLGGAFGTQFDGMAGSAGSDGTWGAGVHAFWRDPKVGLAGAILMHVSAATMTADRHGFEGEYYLSDDFTLGGDGGIQAGDVATSWFGSFDLRFYPHGELMFEAVVSGYNNQKGPHIGFESRPLTEMAPNMAFYGDVGAVTEGQFRTMFGVRLYLGSDGSLIRTHRYFDPPNSLLPFSLNVESALNTVDAIKKNQPAPRRIVGDT